MGWLPTSLLLMVGIIGLALLLVSTAGAVRRASQASHTLSVAVEGRSNRLRAGLAELSAWRAERASRRRDAGETDPGA
jgi:hypothetical protein